MSELASRALRVRLARREMEGIPPPSHYADVNLKDALKRHGHEKLLPNVYEEYKKLLTAQERLAMHKRSTPGKERTRILLELYQKLVATR